MCCAQCFLFVIAAVAEFAAVNHLLVSKSFPPLVARLVDDFFQWTVPVVWCLSNLIFWPILPSPYLDAFFAVVLVAYIAANAFRILWCFRQQKEGMLAPLSALYRHLKHRIEQGERLAREQLQLQQMRRLGITARGAAGPSGRGRGRGRRRGRGRGRSSGEGRGRGASRGRPADEDLQEQSGSARLSVIVTPPTPQQTRAAGGGGDGGGDSESQQERLQHESEQDALSRDGSSVELTSLRDRHDHALAAGREDDEEEEEEELQLEALDDEDDGEDEDEDDGGDSLPSHRSGVYQQAALTDEAEETRDPAMAGEEAEAAELRLVAGRGAGSVREDTSEALLGPDAEDSSGAGGTIDRSSRA